MKTNITKILFIGIIGIIFLLFSIFLREFNVKIVLISFIISLISLPVGILTIFSNKIRNIIIAFIIIFLLSIILPEVYYILYCIGIPILCFLGFLKLINKIIFKNNLNSKELIFLGIIVWIIIFSFNLYSVNSNSPYLIGHKISPYYDGGTVSYCISLGYVIKIYDPVIWDEEQPPITVEFVNLFNRF